MSAAEALKVARSFGIRLVVDGDDLVLKGSAPPPPRVVDLLRRHKAEIMLLLRPAGDGWSADDWQVFFAERGSRVLFANSRGPAGPGGNRGRRATGLRRKRGRPTKAEVLARFGVKSRKGQSGTACVAAKVAWLHLSQIAPPHLGFRIETTRVSVDEIGTHEQVRHRSKSSASYSV